MGKNSFILLFAAMFLISCKPSLQTEKNIPNKVDSTISQKTTGTDMFPKARENETQHIIELPALENEQLHKVEIFVTKRMEVDCNYHSLAGKLEVKELSGWGYDYYLFNTNGEVLSTMMACPDSSLTEKDVISESKLLNYNSKLPIVIYTPRGYQVKYKFWNASSEENTAKPVVLKEQQLTLRFDSREEISFQENKATITIFGFDASLADVPASVIVEKEIDVLSIPLSIRIDVPQNPENLIEPTITSSSEVRYYLSFESEQKNNTSIHLDTKARDIFPNLLDLEDQTFYLSLYTVETN